MWQTYPLNFGYMFHKKTNNRVTPEQKYGPRIAGRILREFLENSNDPLAVAYRERMAESEEEEDVEDQLFRDLWPNTELDSILKLLTRKPGRLSIGERIVGSITRDGENHYTFLEDAHKVKKVVTNRTTIFIRGQYVNLRLKADGSFYPTFNRPKFSEDLTSQDILLGAANELIFFASLIKKV